ncbi:hypothetical protein COCCU_09460 [Corynebacterium occultum]|uniref:DUF3040 domain-containing protein n=1 Tax=Corynebacterium occultum TaxID=2675219 RepID=A0A6B8WAE8_9CORY|nr:DUF3040 domain-containing protein [Corynebacterium occultum]QGU07816.1 hypothetical protein COCCU_09460 [Corynebacterium occultum]
MSLSEQEQRALREIEQSLLADDPKFGAAVAGAGDLGGFGGGLTLRGIALGVLGLVMLIGGVALSQQSLWFIILSVLGFLVMFGAGVWMLRSDSATGSGFGGMGGGRSRKSAASPRASKMEENFRRRFEGQ